MMKNRVTLFILGSILWGNYGSFSQDKPSLDESAQTILKRECIVCHGVAQMSGLDLRTKKTM